MVMGHEFLGPPPMSWTASDRFMLEIGSRPQRKVITIEMMMHKASFPLFETLSPDVT